MRRVGQRFWGGKMGAEGFLTIKAHSPPEPGTESRIPESLHSLLVVFHNYLLIAKWASNPPLSA